MILLSPTICLTFGEKITWIIIGHTLIWHSQLAPWFCVDENGKNVSKEVLNTEH